MVSKLFGVSLEGFRAIFDLEKSRIGSIDGLRALAILMVFNVHFFGFYAAQNYFLDAHSLLSRFIGVLRAGHLGVDFFFVISGYLIYKSVQHKKTDLSFFKKRVFRLLPVHVLVCLYAAKGAPNLTVESFLLNIAFIAPLSGVPLLNDVTWSLTWEWIFYFFVFGVAAMKFNSEKRVLVALVLMTFSFPWLLGLLVDRSVFFFQPERFMAFVFGVALVSVERMNPPRRILKHWRSIVTGAFCGVVALQVVWSLWSSEIIKLPLQAGFYLLASFFFTVVLLAALKEGSFVNELFSNTVLRFFGKISYSFYIVHSLVIANVLNRLSPAESIGAVLLNYVFVLGVATFLASVLYYLLEKPYFNRRSQT